MGPVMPFIPLITSVIGAGASLMGGLAAKDTAGDNAAAVRAQTDEQARRMEGENESKEARARAAAAASGTTLAGTPSSFLDALTRENQTELDYFRRTGGLRAEAQESAGDAAFMGSVGTAAGQIGGGIGGTDFSKLSGTGGTNTKQNTFLMWPGT